MSPRPDEGEYVGAERNALKMVLLAILLVSLPLQLLLWVYFHRLLHWIGGP